MKKVMCNKFLLLFSMLESFCLVYGNLLEKNLSIKDFSLIDFSYFLIGMIIFFISNMLIKKFLDRNFQTNISYLFSWKKVLLYSLFIMILWIPILLAYYPGIWGYDVASQLPHITHQYSHFNHISSQHPITHTLLLELFMILGKTLGNYVLGILLVTIVQMLIVSLSLSFCIEKVKTYVKNRTILKVFMVGILLYYGIMPFSSIMAISSTKDVLFSVFFMV